MPIWSFFFLYTLTPASLKSWVRPCFRANYNLSICDLTKI